MNLRDAIRTIPDFPKPGIQFRDVTTLFGDAGAFSRAVEDLCAPHLSEPPGKVAGIEARGFVLGAAAAFRLGVGFVPLRKRGKLPAATLTVEYSLEYGSDVLQMHRDAVTPGEDVLLIDDLIATGGTADAAVRLLREARAEVREAAFLIDLPALGGAERLRSRGVSVRSLIAFDGH